MLSFKIKLPDKSFNEASIENLNWNILYSLEDLDIERRMVSKTFKKLIDYSAIAIESYSIKSTTKSSESFTDVFDSVKIFLKKLFSYVIDFFRRLGAGIKKFFVTIGDFFKNLFNKLSSKHDLNKFNPDIEKNKLNTIDKTIKENPIKTSYNLEDILIIRKKAYDYKKVFFENINIVNSFTVISLSLSKKILENPVSYIKSSPITILSAIAAFNKNMSNLTNTLLNKANFDLATNKKDHVIINYNDLDKVKGYEEETPDNIVNLSVEFNKTYKEVVNESILLDKKEFDDDKVMTLYEICNNKDIKHCLNLVNKANQNYINGYGLENEDIIKSFINNSTKTIDDAIKTLKDIEKLISNMDKLDVDNPFIPIMAKFFRAIGSTLDITVKVSQYNYGTISYVYNILIKNGLSLSKIVSLTERISNILK